MEIEVINDVGDLCYCCYVHTHMVGLLHQSGIMYWHMAHTCVLCVGRMMINLVPVSASYGLVFLVQGRNVLIDHFLV